jgi:hypothetical protein
VMFRFQGYESRGVKPNGVIKKGVPSTRSLAHYITEPQVCLVSPTTAIRSTHTLLPMIITSHSARSTFAIGDRH